MLVKRVFHKEEEKSCVSHRQTCNNDRVCPGWSKFQCHLMLVFVYSQVVLIGKPLEEVNKNKRSKISMLYEVASGQFSTCPGGLQYPDIISQ